MAKEEKEAPEKGTKANPHKEKRIAANSMYPDKELKRLMKQLDKEFIVMRVWGVVGMAREIATPFGPCPKFTGSFTAIRGSDGQYFTSRVCYLPAYIADELQATYNINGEVSFALDIFAKPSDKGSEGYEFVHTDLMEPQAVADNIGAQLPEFELLSLPAPEAEKAA